MSLRTFFDKFHSVCFSVYSLNGAVGHVRSNLNREQGLRANNRAFLQCACALADAAV